MSNCPPDKQKIADHFNDSLGWNSIPIFGPIVANYWSRPLPPDGQNDLDQANEDFDSATDAFEKAVADSIYKESLTILNLTSLLKPYVNTRITISMLPLEQLVFIMAVQLITVTIISYLIFFRVVH